MINVWFVNFAIASTALWDIIEWDIGQDTTTAKDVLIIVKVVKIIGSEQTFGIPEVGQKEMIGMEEGHGTSSTT